MLYIYIRVCVWGLSLKQAIQLALQVPTLGEVHEIRLTMFKWESFRGKSLTSMVGSSSTGILSLR